MPTEKIANEIKRSLFFLNIATKRAEVPPNHNVQAKILTCLPIQIRLILPPTTFAPSRSSPLRFKQRGSFKHKRLPLRLRG